MWKDLVKCCNCGFKGTVEIGEEKCPKCHKIGCLAWQDENKQEINELRETYKKISCPCCNNKNIRKDYDFPETMRVCKNCGCDFVVNENEEVIDISFNPKEGL